MNKERLEEIAYNVGVSLDGEKALMSSDDYDFLYNYALQQAERVQELEETVEDYKTVNKELHQRGRKVRKQNKRYREALEFYADEETYEPSEVQVGAVTKEGYKILKYKYDPIINTDKGKIARQALEGEK